MKTIFICSPYRVNVKNYADQLVLETNITLAKQYATRLIKEGDMPLAPHLYFTNILDDNNQDERDKGLELGLKWLDQSDEMHVIGDRITEGMQLEIDHARKNNIKVVQV